MREIILDVETTSLDGRITEIGCLEIFDKMPTGNFLHFYINPKEEVSEIAKEISGLTNEFLEDKPEFFVVSEEILDFLGDSPVVAHNASFDSKMLNKELEICGKSKLKNKIIDSLEIARSLFPNAANSLDALCKRFKISIEHRKLHGALKDAELLAQVYYFLYIQKSQFSELEVKKEILRTDFQCREKHVILTEKEKEVNKSFIEKYDFQ